VEFLTVTVYKQGGYNIIVQNGWWNRLVPRVEKKLYMANQIVKNGSLELF
jgi:hypothetical protein